MAYKYVIENVPSFHEQMDDIQNDLHLIYSYEQDNKTRSIVTSLGIGGILVIALGSAYYFLKRSMIRKNKFDSVDGAVAYITYQAKLLKYGKISKSEYLKRKKAALKSFNQVERTEIEARVDELESQTIPSILAKV